MKYKASIIIPCYNKEKYIRRALDSIVSLSRFQDFEVIVVDDCSTDASCEIVAEYAEEYGNISLIAFETGSGSPSKPRNVGIERCSADYLIFMDPDDQIINDGYSLLLSKMEEYESDVLIAARIGVTQSGTQAFLDYVDERFTFTNQKNDSIMLDLLNRRPFILKTIYSKKLIIDNGIRFNEKIKTSEDESFDMQCAAYASKITKINDIVYQYTVESDNSITTGVSIKLYEELYDVMLELYSAYRLSFSDIVAMERIVALVDTFYMNKITYLKTPEDVDKACQCIYRSFEQFGRERFSCLIDRRRIDLVDDIFNRDISGYLYGYYIKRANALARKEAIALRRLRRAKRETRAAKKLLDRRIVKPFANIAKGIDSIKTTQAEGKSNSPMAQAETTDPIRLHADLFNRFSNCLPDSTNGYWVFMDRTDNAKDNAEALYRYVMQHHIHDKLAFLLSEDSIDFERLKTEGFNVIPYDSLEHWSILFSAQFFFTSHCDELELHPWYFVGTQLQKTLKNEHSVQPMYKLVFLQHGVIRSNLSSWLGGKPFYKFVASSVPERDSLLGIPNYRLTNDQLCFTGLSRWDLLEKKDCSNIAIFPTWRKDITFSNEEEFDKVLEESTFLRNWIAFCNHPSVVAESMKREVTFYTHHDNMRMADTLRERIPQTIKVIAYSDIRSFTDIVNTSAMLVTDYSSFSFDFIYQDKTVLYFDFDRNVLANNVRGMEYERFGFYCPELLDAISSFESIVESDFANTEEHLKNIAEAFPIRDGNHRSRLISMLE